MTTGLDSVAAAMTTLTFRSIVIDAYGEDVSYLCRPYVEQSRRMLIEKLRVHGARCSADESAEFAKILGAAGLGDVYGPAASL